MARRAHTYAIRLAVEGGGQVKAELVSCQSRSDRGGGGTRDRSGEPEPMSGPGSGSGAGFQFRGAMETLKDVALAPLRRPAPRESAGQRLGVIWTRDGSDTHEYVVARSTLSTGAYYGSPFQHVVEWRQSFRRRLLDLGVNAERTFLKSAEVNFPTRRLG